MDIAKLKTKEAHDAGSEVRIIGPDGELTDFYITVVGLDSEVWRGITRRQQRAALIAKMDGKDPEAAQDDDPKVLAEASLSWRGLESDGEPVEFDADIAEDLYRNAPYIADQVDRHIAKRANFPNG